MKKEEVTFNIKETCGSLARTATLGFESEDHLVEYLRGKVVLDLGSGGGIFAKQAYQRLNCQTTIYSMNPRLVYETRLKKHRDCDQDYRFATNSPEIERYQATAVAADWESIPFAKQTFDTIFASGSFLFYYDTYSPGTMNQIIDLLKPTTGEFRCSLGDYVIDDVYKAEKVAKQRGCSFEIYQGKKLRLYNPYFYLKMNKGNE